MKKRPKKMPFNGPPIIVQQARINLIKRDPETVKFIRDWIKDQKSTHGRPETIEAYETI